MDSQADYLLAKSQTEWVQKEQVPWKWAQKYQEGLACNWHRKIIQILKEDAQANKEYLVSLLSKNKLIYMK